jgi:predicted RNA-binding Zn-ribbon protein involved in translation (DUF1610 family)
MLVVGSQRQTWGARLNAGFFLGCRSKEWAMVKSEAELVKCPNCGSQYKLVRVEAERDPSHGRIECRRCGGPLSGREGRFILKYFLIDRPRRQLKPTRVK